MSDPKNTIVVENPASLPTLPFKVLKEQYKANALKDKRRDVSDLKRSIALMGFKIPLFVWVKGKYITDGAGRMKALEMLEYEGYDIPPIPYVPVESKDLKEAKRLTLAISSQYGAITEESAGEFMLGMDEIDLTFISLPGLNLEEIDWTPPQAPKEKKEREKGVTKMMHECPKCGHEFN